MKKNLLVIGLASASIVFLGFSNSFQKTVPESYAENSVEIPEDVMAVIKNSCFGCHNEESRNEDAKKELKFDKLDDLKSFELMGLLDDIKEEVSEGKMPPKKFLEHYPDNALSEDNKKVLLSWVDKTSKNLSGDK